MKKAAVVCDNWKLPTFEEILKEEGFSYEVVGAFTPAATALNVLFNESQLPRLDATIRRCERTAQQRKAKRN